jgi:DNA primase
MEFVEQLKSSVDIVTVVGEYVRLRKAGTRWVGLCPFHTEKSPSFGVNTTHQFYKCFGCGAGGDVLKFVMEVERVTFFEALKMLSERYGIPMPKRQEFSDPESRRRSSLFDLHELAADIFRANLASGNGAAARAYLAKRGVSQQTATEFGLGLSERSGNGLLRALEGKGFSEEQLAQSGLFSRREGGGLFDRFRGRLMFPIHNESGKTIGFGGRALAADDEPKYLNSPKTDLYDKGYVLYNLHRAKGHVRKADRVVLVEGYMDVIGVSAAGVQEVVASCGTALTNTQVRALKRHSEKVVVNFDPDTAGANATEKSIQMLLEEGMHVRILQLEGGLDPDEYARENGADAYRARLEKAGGYFHFLADQARKRFDMRSGEGRYEGFQFLLGAIQRIPDKLERVAIANDVAGYLGVEPGMILDQFRKAASDRKNTVAAAPQGKTAGPPAVETLLLNALLGSEEARVTVLPRLRALRSVEQFKTVKIVRALLLLCEQDDAPNYSKLEARLEEADRALLAQMVMADENSESDWPQQALSCVEQLEAAEKEMRAGELQARMKAAERAGNLKEAMELMAELDRFGATKKRRTAG